VFRAHRRYPKVTAALSYSGRFSASLLDMIEIPDHAIELTEIFCSPSTSPSPWGSPRPLLIPPLARMLLETTLET
jgi:hypothetical protein